MVDMIAGVGGSGCEGDDLKRDAAAHIQYGHVLQNGSTDTADYRSIGSTTTADHRYLTYPSNVHHSGPPLG